MTKLKKIPGSTYRQRYPGEKIERNETITRERRLCHATYKRKAKRKKQNLVFSIPSSIGTLKYHAQQSHSEEISTGYFEYVSSRVEHRK